MQQAEKDQLVLVTFLVSTLFATIQYGHLLNGISRKRDIPLVERVRFHLVGSRAGQFAEAVAALMSLVSCGTYIYETYLDHTPIGLFAAEIVFAVFFTYQYVILLYTARRRLIYIIGMQSIVDIVTIVPVYYVALLGGDYQFDDIAFLRFGRVLKFARVLRLLRIFRSFSLVSSPTSDAINHQVAVMVSTILGIVVVCTGMVHWLGNDCNLWYDLRVDECLALQFHDALYFTVVTFSTVGYGDISPGRAVSRMLVVVLIISAFLLVPMQTQQLAHLISMRPAYSGAFIMRQEDKHIVIVMDRNVQGIISFVKELFHEDHGMHSTRVVILSPDMPDSALKELILTYAKKLSVQYLRGDAQSRTDLMRARMDVASACYVFTNQQAPQATQQDAVTTLRALTARSINQHANIFVQLIEPGKRQQLVAAGIRPDHIICTMELKQKLLAMNTVCRGFSTLVTNLISSAGFEGSPDDPAWIQEYCEGFSQEIYMVESLAAYTGMSYSAAATTIYDRFGGCVLFALGKPTIDSYGQHSYVVLLNPGSDTHVLEDHVGFVLAESQDIADDIASTTGKHFADQKHHAKDVLSKLGSCFCIKSRLEHLIAAWKTFGIKCKRTSLLPPPLPPKVSNSCRSPQSHLPGSMPMHIVSEQYFNGKNNFVCEPPPGGKRWLLPHTYQSQREQRTLVKRHEAEMHLSECEVVTGLSRQNKTFQTPKERNEIAKRSRLQHALAVAERVTTDDLCGHVIVVGPLIQDVHSLVATLRDPQLQLHRPIIFLTPAQPSENIWQTIQHFPNVFWMVGTPVMKDILENINAVQAHTVIVRAQGRRDMRVGTEDSTSVMDAEVVMDVAGIESKLGSEAPPIVAEINDENQMLHLNPAGFLHSNSNIADQSDGDIDVDVSLELGLDQASKIEPKLLPAFAAGKVIDNYTSELLLCQSYFNNTIILIIQALVSAQAENNSCTEPPQVAPSTRICQLDCPTQLQGMSYGALFTTLLMEYSLLSLGLYRKRNNHAEALLPYVVTNPTASLVVNQDDKIFVIGT
mmetsp:Transcript_8258/g.28977  ORF Transcript_8258/g.28977 Transcript_8258/m.28977 type:complete len:1035 (-) Transcript_8258:398-3502(-)|eukprot:CAMPEP_0183798802 /NCGR_PEP_ID=MMETSP0803_2-20130417/19868_1 /TAXON_ID=195967 /ORGANISM="Crustomastix stigmata, Strain CCMP3273" /LENGTH=1034 /DNA_ID=CAMNT_0026043497 /DNA_START=276 /DNA_END=3383 /DNA_ORIENTATION=-